MGSSTETRALGSKPTELIFRRFRVQVASGKDLGLERCSEAAEFAIGAAEGNQLLLTDPTVSRHHCTILAGPDGYLLRDLGSTNGTTLAGYRIESAYLKTGAIIGLGETTLRFEGLSEAIHEPLSSEARWGRALGQSPAMRRLFALLPRIAASESTVLLEGETGTGKTMFAEAIHQASPRAASPFMVLDCSAIPPTLIESELFGHDKGAFTGAHASRIGAFEAAQGGTIFLDEIGELPMDMQPKLLRALEERAIKRIGSTVPVKLDVRVIAATNRDLREMVNRNAFRSDLFYRLNIVRLRIPALRERREDIPLLVAYFYEQFVPDGGTPSRALLDALSAQDWRGNVRELRSSVERAALLGDMDLWHEISEGGQPASRGEMAGEPDIFDETMSYRAAKERSTSRWERWYITELVRRNGGNLSQSARQARMDRNHLRELLRRHQVSAHEE